MKRNLVLLLTLLLCMPLIACACSGDAPAQKALVGEWQSTAYDNRSLTVKADGTAELCMDGETEELRWSYMSDLQGYLLALPSQASGLIFVTIEENEGCRYVKINNNLLYDADTIDEARDVESKRKVEVVNGYFEDCTKIELGKAFAYQPGVSMTITEVKWNEERTKVEFKGSLTNAAEEDSHLQTMQTRLEGVYDKTKYLDFGGITWSTTLPQVGKTQEISGLLGSVYSNVGSYGDINIKLALCGLTIGENKYVIDLTEVLK